MVLKISVQRQRKDTEGTRLSLGWLSWLSGLAALIFHAGTKPIIKLSWWASDVRAIGFRQWKDDSLLAPDPLRSQSRQIACVSRAGFSEFQFYYLLHENLDQMATKDLLIFKMGERLGHPYSDLFTVHIVGIWNVPQFHGPQLVSQIDLAVNLTQPRVNWEENFIGRTAQIRVACGMWRTGGPSTLWMAQSPCWWFLAI